MTDKQNNNPEQAEGQAAETKVLPRVEAYSKWNPLYFIRTDRINPAFGYLDSVRAESLEAAMAVAIRVGKGWDRAIVYLEDESGKMLEINTNTGMVSK